MSRADRIPPVPTFRLAYSGAVLRLLHDVARAARHARGTDLPAVTVRAREDVDTPVVALTFDDGPGPWTEPILDRLGEAAARATFFVIGDAIAGNERTLRRIRDEGHEVGNHTMTHPRLDTVRRRTIVRELRRANAAVERVLGVPPTCFRPPGFHYTTAVLEVARAVGFDRVVLASATTDDYRRDSAEEIVDAIAPRVAPGGIIDLHDGRPPGEPSPDAGGSRLDRAATVRAVELLLERLDGFAFVTVAELFAG
jgi:peptidoglycan/xylan/chitin deacetylase (PgdA/CDA1 family)